MTTDQGHRYYTEGDLADLAAEWSALRDGLASIGRHAAVLDAAHGSTSPERSTHAGLRPERMRHGVPTPTAAPDPFTGQHATIKRGRNKRGTTLKVTHVGRAYVPGPDVNRERDVTGRVRSVRLDALTLARMADEILARNLAEGETLESAGLSLVGSVQGASWESIVRAEGSRDAVTLAQHRTDIGGGFIDARRIILTDARRADHKYRPTHSHALGNTLDDAAACDKGRPVRKVRTFPITRLLRGAPPVIARAATPRKLDPDTVPVEYTGRDGKVRTSYRHSGITADGRLVTYGDRIVTRRTIPDASRPSRMRTVIGTASTERVAVGHAWQDRPMPTRQGSNAARAAANAERLARRTVEARSVAAQVSTDADGAAVLDAWNAVTDGTRVTVPLPTGGRLTFTRADGRPVRYVYDSGAAQLTWTSRTPTAALIRLARVG